MGEMQSPSEKVIHYTIRRAEHPPDLTSGWDSDPWRRGDVLEVTHFHAQSGTHRPITRTRVLYDDKGLSLFFHVIDRYVRCLWTRYQDPVCEDSCVEFFVQPKPDRGFFNFEMNCGGTLMVSYSTADGSDWSRNRTVASVPFELGRQVKIHHTLPARVEPELTEPTLWELSCFIPFSLLEHYVGPLGKLQGQCWRANFFKCGDHTSHPHWAAWSPIGPELDFHQPRYFGTVIFEG